MGNLSRLLQTDIGRTEIRKGASAVVARHCFARLDRNQYWFSPRIPTLIGGQRVAAQSLETIDQCAVLRAHAGANALDEWAGSHRWAVPANGLSTLTQSSRYARFCSAAGMSKLTKDEMMYLSSERGICPQCA